MRATDVQPVLEGFVVRPSRDEATPTEIYPE